MKYLILVLFFSCTHKSIKLVDKVDLKRYQGKWYEISRFNQYFQRECTKSQATYTLRSDGDIDVLNECIRKDNKIQRGTARAWSTNNQNNKLKVQFFLKKWKIPFIAGNYWIIELDENYEYVAVGDNSREYLWILSRKEKIDEQAYEHLLAKLSKKGFDISRLVRYR